MRIRRFKRKLAPLVHVFGEPNEAGQVPVLDKRNLRRLQREQRTRARNDPHAAEALAAAESKRDRRRARNLEAK